MPKLLISGIILLFVSIAEAQTDTGHIRSLPEITIVGKGSRNDYQQMPEIVGTNIYAGKKNALIVLDNVQGNVATNNMRQVLSKVAGIHIWESDASGIQIGIAARGLSPNRSWEFNIRQNGYDIAADPFGYPEAYYNPQLQAVQRIEIVRGQGALQYGPQFGGLVNYILRNGSEIQKKFEVETQQTVGSNNLYNNFLALGGKTKRVHYYSFFDHRKGDGWRMNSGYFTNAGYGTVTWYVKPNFSVSAELMHSHIRSQQAGGLTEKQFSEDARQSQRGRNWFDISWTTPALILNYQLNSNTRWNTKFFGTIGNRNSVGFLQSMLVADTINHATGTYANRSLQIDEYRNYGMESRFITDYRSGKLTNTLSAGIRMYTGSTFRRANGKGTTGMEYDMRSLAVYPTAIKFESRNMAAFVEHIFRVNEKWLIIPGVRWEWLRGEANGQNGLTSSGQPIWLQSIARSRSFLLGGIGTEYHVSPSTEIYGNITQAYRPIQFANLQAPPTTDVVDQDLKDGKGFNADLGYRGRYKNWLLFDFSIYYLQYNNRIGTITTNGTPSYRLITNVGNSISKGIESFAELDLARLLKNMKQIRLKVFASYSYNDAFYTADHKDAGTRGKKLENAPMHILRSGVNAGYRNWLLTLQSSYTGSVYSDANNTITPSSNGNAGRIPSYNIIDLSMSFIPTAKWQVKAGITNLADTKYFTRRAGGYPGPGLLPADGRLFFASIGIKI